MISPWFFVRSVAGKRRSEDRGSHRWTDDNPSRGCHITAHTAAPCRLTEPRFERSIRRGGHSKHARSLWIKRGINQGGGSPQRPPPVCARLTGVGTGVNINNDGRRTVSQQPVIRRGGWSRRSEWDAVAQVVTWIDAIAEQLVRTSKQRECYQLDDVAF